MPNSSKNRLTQVYAALERAAQEGMQKVEEMQQLRKLLIDMGFILKGTPGIYDGSPASQLSSSDLQLLRSLPEVLKYLSKMPGPRGYKGDRGEQGEKGDPGKDGKDGSANPEEIFSIAERLVSAHENQFDHRLLHDPTMLGTKAVDESTIGPDKYLKFNGTKLVYADAPKDEQRFISYGGSSLSDQFRVDRVITADATLDPAERRIHVDATAGNITITFHAASGFDRNSKFIKRIDSTANTVTLTPAAGETLEFQSSDQLPNQGSSRLYYAFSGNWYLQSA